MPALTTRTLNRTLLRRQFLTARTALPAREIVHRLVALQGQEPDAPYIGLWTRKNAFEHEGLTGLLHDGTVVRGALLRTTQHIALAGDFRWLRPTVQPVLDRVITGAVRAELTGLDRAELDEEVRRLLATEALTRPQIGRLLTERFPGRDPAALAAAAHFRLPLLHPAPSGTWGHRGKITCVHADTVLGEPLDADVEEMVRRYLAAFGPASVKDVQTWSGLTRLRETLDRMRGLRAYRDEAGTELFDLADAELADEDTPVPVRFLPAFDNVLLGHADRARIIHPGDRKQVTPGLSIVRPTFLVDGFVAGIWSLRGGELTVTPFRPLGDREAVAAEAEELAAFAAPGARVVFA